MKKQKKTALVPVLSLVLTAFLLSAGACSFGEGSTTVTGKDEQTSADTGTAQDDVSSTPAVTDRFAKQHKTAEQALENVQTTDMQGLSYIITCTDEDTFADDETVISRERYRTMSLLAERLNVDFVYAQASAEEIAAGLKEEKTSSIVYSHLLQTDVSDIGTLTSKGYLGSIDLLPFVDLGNPYYDQSFCSDMHTLTGLYALRGDGVSDNGSYKAVIYNETMRKSFNVEELEGIAAAGGWTYDEMNEISKLIVADEGGEAGLYAILCDTKQTFSETMYIAAEMQSVKRTEKVLKVNDNKTRGTKLLKTYDKLLKNSCLFESPDDGNISNVFFGGSAMFYVGTLSDVERIYNSKDVWGLLPIPKLAQDEEYSTPLSWDTDVICYPASTPNSTETGIMIESLFAASYTVTDAAYADHFLHSYARNSKTIDMLLLIMENVRGDFVLGYGLKYKNYRTGTIDAFYEACTTVYEYPNLINYYRYSAESSLDSVR